MRVILLAVLLALPPGTGAGARHRQPVDPPRGGIVRVDAGGCPTRPRRGSGFAWRSPGTIVTSLHVVAGCSTIGVRYPVAGGKYRPAKIMRVLKEDDLALLAVQSPPAVAPLAIAAAAPGPGAAMVVWGYPVPVRGLLDTHLIRRSSSGTLDDLVNTDVQQEIRNAGMPSLQVNVLFLDGGHLLPGHSGAPLVNDAGEVVGVADGGLEQGAVEINWAIPAAALAPLAASGEALSVPAARTDKLFAAELVDTAALEEFNVDVDAAQPRAVMAQIAPGATAYTCGSATFARVRTRTLAELMQAADDKLGLNQLLSGYSRLVRFTDRYDIYQDVATGATVVTPAGSSMRTNLGFCVIDVLPSALQQVIRVGIARNAMEAQSESVRYEMDLGKVLGGGWQVDPAWTYLQPVFRPDSAVVRRKASIQFAPSPAGPVWTKYAFESLTAKGGFFLGVTAIRYDLSPQIVQLQQSCYMALPAAPPQCAPALNALRLLMDMNVATHLSTFPMS